MSELSAWRLGYNIRGDLTVEGETNQARSIGYYRQTQHLDAARHGLEARDEEVEMLKNALPLLAGESVERSGDLLQIVHSHANVGT